MSRRNSNTPKEEPLYEHKFKKEKCDEACSSRKLEQVAYHKFDDEYKGDRALDTTKPHYASHIDSLDLLLSDMQTMSIKASEEDKTSILTKLDQMRSIITAQPNFSEDTDTKQQYGASQMNYGINRTPSHAKPRKTKDGLDSLYNEFDGKANISDIVAAVHEDISRKPAQSHHCRFCAHHGIKQELAGHDCYYKKSCTTPRCYRLRARNRIRAEEQKARYDAQAIAPLDGLRVVAGRGKEELFLPAGQKHHKLDKYK